MHKKQGIGQPCAARSSAFRSRHLEPNTISIKSGLDERDPELVSEKLDLVRSKNLDRSIRRESENLDRPFSKAARGAVDPARKTRAPCSAAVREPAVPTRPSEQGSLPRAPSGSPPPGAGRGAPRRPGRSPRRHRRRCSASSRRRTRGVRPRSRCSGRRRAARAATEGFAGTRGEETAPAWPLPRDFAGGAGDRMATTALKVLRYAFRVECRRRKW